MVNVKYLCVNIKYILGIKIKFYVKAYIKRVDFPSDILLPPPRMWDFTYIYTCEEFINIVP